jgi:type IV secretion system protein TrbD
MAVSFEALDTVRGFSVPVHRALTEPILLGGAPRSVAILNGTLAGAVGLGLQLWLAGILIWAVGHIAAVWAAKRGSALRRGRAPPSAYPRPSLGVRHEP